MKTFKVITLVDITETKQYRREPNKDLEREQQQNFQMLLQTIGMRVNPSYRRGPSNEILDLKHLFFGSEYNGSHRVWTFEFDTEYDEGFTDETNNEVGLLVNDLHYVPFTPDLTETVNIRVPVFDTQSGQYRNTIIYLQD